MEMSFDLPGIDKAAHEFWQRFPPQGSPQAPAHAAMQGTSHAATQGASQAAAMQSAPQIPPQAATQPVFAIHGSMGAGKTTFIHALCTSLGVRDTIGSPTFSIINEYNYPGGKIYHMDLYRLRDEEEALRAGVEDCLYSGSLCLVEWPDRAPGIFPADTIHVHLEILDPLTRKITV